MGTAEKSRSKSRAMVLEGLGGVLGPAHKVMTVDDPHEEVSYDEDFACNDLGHKYLDESTLERLLAEADGELARDDSVGSENHPPNSVKRIKRRRKQNVQLTSRLTQSPGGTIYYRMTEMPDSDGARPKSKTVKLASKSLDKALKEVARRDSTNSRKKKRRKKSLTEQGQASRLSSFPVLMNSASTDRSSELVQLMMTYQRRIFAYIHTLVPSRSDAEDILQETSLTICEKFKDFEIGTNFYSWACQIAYWKVRAARKKFATSKVVFNQEVLDVISQTRGEMVEELDHRHGALARCLEKLNDRDRRMVLTRYESGKNVTAAAQACGRTVQGAYKALTRIRKALFDCVSFEVSTEQVR